MQSKWEISGYVKVSACVILEYSSLDLHCGSSNLMVRYILITRSKLFDSYAKWAIF